MFTNKLYLGPMDGIVELPDHFYAISDFDKKNFVSMNGETIVMTTDVRKAILFTERDMAEGMLRNGVKEQTLISKGYRLKIVPVVKDFRLMK